MIIFILDCVLVSDLLYAYKPKYSSCDNNSLLIISCHYTFSQAEFSFCHLTFVLLDDLMELDCI